MNASYSVHLLVICPWRQLFMYSMCVCMPFSSLIIHGTHSVSSLVPAQPSHIKNVFISHNSMADSKPSSSWSPSSFTYPLFFLWLLLSRLSFHLVNLSSLPIAINIWAWGVCVCVQTTRQAIESVLIRHFLEQEVGCGLCVMSQEEEIVSQFAKHEGENEENF